MGTLNRGEWEAAEVIQCAVDLFNYSEAELFGASRSRHLVRRRQATFYVLRVLTDHSYPELAQITGFDHTTIQHAIEKVRKEQQSGGGVTYLVSQKLLNACQALPDFVEFY